MITLEEIQETISQVIAQELHISAAELSHQTTFQDLGLDSVNSIFLIGEMERKLGVDIDPMSVYDNPSIESFAKYLSSVLND